MSYEKLKGILYLAMNRNFHREYDNLYDIVVKNKDMLDIVCKEDLVLLLYDLIFQVCGYEVFDKSNDKVVWKGDSHAISVYRDAMYLLADLDLIEIKESYGRRVICVFHLEGDGK